MFPLDDHKLLRGASCGTFGFHSTQGNASKLNEKDIFLSLHLCICVCLRQAYFHGEISTLVLALVLASLLKPGLSCHLTKSRS